MNFTRALTNITWAQAQVCLGVDMPLAHLERINREKCSELQNRKKKKQIWLRPRSMTISI